MKMFEGRTAMVTGAGKNIGKEIALDFAKNGANVIVCDYNEENALETVAEIKALGVQAMPAVCDVRDREKIFKYVGEAIELFGKQILFQRCHKHKLSRLGINKEISVVGLGISTLIKLISHHKVNSVL